MDRFHGKPVISCHVADGISKAEELLDEAISGKVPLYQAETKPQETVKASGSVGHKIYMQLMNGVSHMLPFVVGGGILIAIAFLIDGLSVDMTTLPAEMRANFGTITPAAALFKQIGGVAFAFMLPVLAGFIAMSIGDRPGLALGFVGGSIAASGSSCFLGALVAGFLAGYTIVFLRKIFDKLPEALEKIAPVLLYPDCRSDHVLRGGTSCWCAEYSHEYSSDKHERYKQSAAGYPGSRYDVHRYGRPFQQSSLCIRYCFHCGR